MKSEAMHVAITLAVMLVVSRFLVRLVDATVQIDDDLGMLALLLLVVNAAIGAVSYWINRRPQRWP